MITVLQSDGENNPDILAGIGASAALVTSTIPWNGPIATVRVGRINGDFIINPTRSESKDSDVEMIVSGNSETIVMVEGEANIISEKDVLAGLKAAHLVIKEIIDLQIKLMDKLDVRKEVFDSEKVEEKLDIDVEKLAKNRVEKIIKLVDKKERSESILNLKKDTIEKLIEEYPEQEKQIEKILDGKFKESLEKEFYHQEFEVMEERQMISVIS